MISVKTSLAFLITIVLAIIAYFITSAAFSSDIRMLLPSIFIIVTTVSFLIVSNLQNTTRTSPNTSKREATTAPDNSSADVTTLYVGNLAYKANEQTVQEYFETVGKVKSVRLVKDKRTGRRKGFGFIEIDNGDVNRFISKLNESEFMERSIIVRPANEKQH